MATISVWNIGGHALPHFLEVTPKNKGGYTARGVFEDGLDVGDTVIPFFLDYNIVVESITEKRPPRGDWSGDSYKGKTPMYYEFEATKAERPKPELSNERL
jgi:hypothetical protein